MTTQRILWYFADPMCSWCWGFAPVMDAIHEKYAGRMKIALMLGGLRPGTTEPMTPESREEILHHWREVHRMTGQPFAFESPMPAGFVYDTEPPSRAVMVIADINSDAVFPYFKSVQEAFYARAQNVTQPDILAGLAEHHSIERAEFLDRFNSDDIRKKTQTHFQIAHQSGVRGFPTVVLQNGTTGTLLTRGYRPFGDLQASIDRWLTPPE